MRKVPGFRAAPIAVPRERGTVCHCINSGRHIDALVVGANVELAATDFPDNGNLRTRLSLRVAVHTANMRLQFVLSVKRPSSCIHATSAERHLAPEVRFIGGVESRVMSL